MGGQRHAQAALSPGENRYLLYGKLGGPQGRSGRVQKISPTPRFDPRTFQPVANCYTVWAIATHNKIHTKNKKSIIFSLKIMTNYEQRLSQDTGLFFLWRCDPTRVMAFSFLRFLDHTQRRTTVGRTPLDEWSARRRDLYLTTHNTHNRKISMPPVGFEPTISAGERPQTARPLGPAILVT